jgi:hypothetical protein
VTTWVRLYSLAPIGQESPKNYQEPKYFTGKGRALVSTSACIAARQARGLSSPPSACNHATHIRRAPYEAFGVFGTTRQ